MTWPLEERSKKQDRINSGWTDYPFAAEVELSKAISLKRIADALSGEDGEGIFRQPINSYGETVGEAIQGQITRGFQQGAEWLPRGR